MWKKIAMTAVAILGMAAPAMAKADEPCESEAYVQPTYAQPYYAQPYYARDYRDDYWRMRQHRRWERMRHWEGRRERGYGRRW